MKHNLRLMILLSLFALLFFPTAQAALAEEEHPHMHAEVDIKPGSYPNTINIRSSGTVAVALFGSDMFDLSSVDFSSVRLHPMGNHDIGAAAIRYAYEDVNLDGILDVVFHFEIQAIGLQPGDEMACLHGMTTSGEHFCGHDSVRVVSK